MSEQLIIALGREFGSGGHEIAKRLSERLNMPLYDRNLLDHMFEDEEQKKTLAKYEERGHRFYLSRHVRGFSNSIEENLAHMQFDFIRKKAEEGESFIIVGRCGETVLRGHQALVSVFILGDLHEKIRRVEQVYNLPEKEAVEKLQRHDRIRKKYHNTFSDTKWGDARGYDLCLNSSRLSMEKCVDVICDYIEKRREGSDRL